MEGNALGLCVVCGTDKNTIRSSSGDFPIISERVGYCLNFKRSLPGEGGGVEHQDTMCLRCKLFLQLKDNKF